MVVAHVGCLTGICIKDRSSSGCTSWHRGFCLTFVWVNRDLVEVAVKQKRTILESQLRFAAKEKAEAKVLEALAGKMPVSWLRGEDTEGCS